MAAVLGLDIGEKRIGVAVSDESQILAMPLVVMAFEGRKKFLQKLEVLAQEYKVETIVMGHPITMAGVSGIAAGKIEELAKWLKENSKYQWILWDERLSTAEVEKFLIAADVSRAKRKEVRDKLAAQRILQNYLDYQSHQKL